MTRISVVMLVHNEEKNLLRSLPALNGFAHEVILADSGSDDGTAEVAAKHSAILLHLEWKGYGPTRNEAAAHAKGDVILFLDADEVVTPEFKAEVRSLSASVISTHAFRIRRRNHIGNKEIRFGAWNPDFKLRMVPRGKGEWDTKPVHESLHPAPGIPVLDVLGSVDHYTYADFDDLRQRSLKYAALAATHIQESGIKSRWLRKWMSPLAVLFRDIVLKSGWRDGNAGFHIAWVRAWAAWRKYGWKIDD